MQIHSIATHKCQTWQFTKYDKLDDESLNTKNLNNGFKHVFNLQNEHIKYKV